MLRSFAALLLLLGLAPATPMVCLRAPAGVIAASAVTAVGSVIATVAEVPSAGSWQLSQPGSVARVALPALAERPEQVQSPKASPPQSA